MSLALAANAADIAGQGPASVLFGVCDIISNSANAVRFNKEAATALASRIRDIVLALTEEHTSEGFKPSPEWTAGINNFKCALDAITQDLQSISKQTFLAQALHRERDAEAIRGMGQRVRDVTALFMTKARIEILDHVQVLNTALESATIAVTVPSIPAQRLEHPPAYYLGRTSETESAVTLLDSDIPGYVAILGGPGMGKTSLAQAVLHHPALATRFGLKRYFIACDAADSRMTLLSLLSSAFNIATSNGSVAKRALKSMLHGPSLLLLDNFESAWESPDQRQETESVLGFLASIHGLSIMITLRGSERPQGVPWTTPHLLPLATLGSTFASQLFVAISDIDEANPDLSKLLMCTDHIPLAIVLMANLAQYESSYTLLARWKREKTAMLQRNGGNHCLTSMDISLSLSISSPRITSHPPAVQLLGLLSMLPQGARTTDIEAWFPSMDVGRAISVVLQTALAIRSSTHRLYVLAPIREFMLSTHYPRTAGIAALFDHYWALAQLIDPEGQESSSAMAVACVLPELENIYSITSHGLKDSSHRESAATAAVSLASLLAGTGYGSFAIIGEALLVSRACNLDNITATLLYMWGLLVYQSAAEGDCQILWTEAQSLYRSTGNLGGVIDTTLRQSSFIPPEQASEVIQHMYTLAKDANDWRRVAWSLIFLALAHDRTGDNILSQQYLQDALNVIYSELPNSPRLLGHTLYTLGQIFCSAGDLKSGMTKLDEAIPFLWAANDRIMWGATHSAIGQICVRRGKNVEALAHLHNSLEAKQKAHDVRGQIGSFHSYVMAHLGLGDSLAALEVVKRIDVLLDEDSTARLSSYCHALSLHAKGVLAAAGGNTEDADAAFQGAIMLSHLEDKNELRDNCLWIESVTLCSRGKLEQDKGNMHERVKCFIISAAVFRHPSQPELLQSLTGLAQVIDDEASTCLLAAIMLPLLHSSLNAFLADAFLTSADIASRQHNTCLAHYRVQSAMRYLEEVDTVKLHERANTMLEKCTVTPSV